MRRCIECATKHTDYVSDYGHLSMDRATGATVLVPHGPIVWARPTSAELWTFRSRLGRAWPQSVRDRAFRGGPATEIERGSGIGYHDRAPVTMPSPDDESSLSETYWTEGVGAVTITQAPVGAWWGWLLRLRDA